MQAGSDLESSIASRAWAIPLLTLDSVLPFHELLGLPSTKTSPTLMDVLREVTVAVRRQVGLAATRETTHTIGAYLQALATAMGPNVQEHFVWWLQNVFHADTQSHSALSGWDYMLRHCRHSSRDWERLHLPKELSSEILKRFRATIDISEYHLRYKQVQATPLSDWDLHMYASQLYDLDDDKPCLLTVNPFLTIELTIRNYQGYRFWAWVLRELSPDEQTQLWEMARQIANGDKLTSLAKLQHPSILDIGL